MKDDISPSYTLMKEDILEYILDAILWKYMDIKGHKGCIKFMY